MTTLPFMSPWGFAWGDPQERRANELNEIPSGRRYAPAVRRCGQQLFGKTLVCGKRFCPGCGARYRAENASKVEERIELLVEDGVLGLFRIPCLTAALGETMCELRTTLTELHRTKLLKDVRAVGWIEPHYSGHDRWLVHAHVVFDLDEKLVFEGAFEDAVNAAFRERTDDKGRFSFDPIQPVVEVPARISRYIVKTGDWCPGPGVDLEVLEALLPALHGRHLALTWGLRKKPTT